MKKYLLLLMILLSSCARAPLKRIEDALRPAADAPKLVDSLSRESFFVTLKKHVAVMKTSRQVMNVMTFGERKIEKSRYIAALEKIFEHENDWTDYIEENFDFYEVYGREKWGEVMSTGYYEPKVFGSMKKSSEFSQAIYSTPPDLVTVNLKNFVSVVPSLPNQGQIVGRVENRNIYPYYDRKQIDVDQKLKGKSLEIAWVDPLDSFFIQIQGSGVIELEKGERFRIGYDAQNGYPYEAIGKYLTDFIPIEKMSLQRIRAHLNTLPKKEKQAVLNKNPSYIFFKKLESDALTYAGMEVSDGRTIATDVHLFPKGALAFLDIEEPVFATPEDEEPVAWEKKPRLVFDQDTGGAIKGGGRVDLYFGQGAAAAQKAGVMKQNGRLYYLVPR
ncbi:MAG: murein transglycosylase A [Bacteriovorax sp.]|jgi:membrane-bound lytic murein transglycosylase A